MQKRQKRKKKGKDLQKDLTNVYIKYIILTTI